MKKSLVLTRPGTAVLAATLGTFVSLSAVAQTPAAAQAPVPAPAAKPARSATSPKLVVPVEKAEVGTVAKGDLIKKEFVVKNEGKGDLHITDVKPSCGCTVPEFDKVIKPGTEGKIVLSIDTKAFQGPISKTALVLTDDPDLPQFTLFVTANVKPFIEMSPYGFFRLQALTGQEATSEIILTSDEPDFKPTKVEAPHSFLKATLTPVPEAERIAGKNANQWKVTLSTSKEAPEGLLGGYVKVATGVAKQPELSMAISGFIKPIISVTPMSVNLGNFAVKAEPVKRTITVVNNNAKNEGFQVLKADSSVTGITAQVVPREKGRFEVVLTVDEKIKKGPIDGSITISTNETTRPEIKIPLKGLIL